MKMFATRLRKARKAAGWRSAESFANQLGLDPHAYRKYERTGKNSAMPPPMTVILICDRLGISTSYLLPSEADRRAQKGAKQLSDAA